MKVTIADIAREANVSKMTVSRVLSGKGQVAPETAERIRKVIDKMEYHPNLIARSLASKKTKIIGVIVPKIEHMFLDNYIAQILSGVTDVALKNDYKIILCPVDISRESDTAYLNISRTKMLDGMILVKTKINDPNLKKLVEIDFPFVLVNYKCSSDKIHYIDSHNIKGAKMAVKYLYNLGHRKIAFVAGSMDETNARDRMRGFKTAMTEYNLHCPDEWIIYGDFSKEKAYAESEKFFTGDTIPTAIFCSDDYMAIGVMERIKNKNLGIPEDIAVMGFDDIELAAYVKPSLTTIRQPIYELGKSSAEMLLNIVNRNENIQKHKILDVELIKRESA
ncbi:MAG: LacI family DNA-binding transcriptional regulator [bacterium]